MSIKLTIRPWSDMIDAHSFSVPKGIDTLSERVRINLNYYLGNYLIITAIFVLLSGYFYNGLLVAGFLAVAGVAGTIFTKDLRLEVGGVVITELHKYALTAVIALFALYWSETFQPLLVTLAIAGIVVLVHAGARAKVGLKEKAKAGIDNLTKDIRDELKTK